MAKTYTFKLVINKQQIDKKDFKLKIINKIYFIYNFYFLNLNLFIYCKSYKRFIRKKRKNRLKSLNLHTKTTKIKICSIQAQTKQSILEQILLALNIYIFKQFSTSIFDFIKFRPVVVFLYSFKNCVFLFVFCLWV